MSHDRDCSECGGMFGKHSGYCQTLRRQSVTNKVETNLDKAVLTISEQITTLQLYMVRRLDELDEGLATLQQSQDELAKAVDELADEVLTERRRWEEE